MKKNIAIIVMVALGFVGCSTKKPDIALKEALAKSHTATSCNQHGEIKIDRLILKIIPKPTKDFDSQEAIDILKATSISYDAAVDETNAKMDVVYTIKSRYDGIDMNIPVQLMLDYKNQSIYVGNSIFDTIVSLGIKFDKKITKREKENLAKIKSIVSKHEYTKLDLSPNSEFFKELKAQSTKKERAKIEKNLKLLTDEMKFNETQFRKDMEFYKNTETKIFNDINATNFSYDKDDKQTVQIALDNNQTAKLAGSIANITIDYIATTDSKYKSEIDKLDRKKMQKVINEIFNTVINATTIMRGSINKEGYISRFDTKFQISDKKDELGLIAFSINNTTSNYNSPKFKFDANDSSKYIDAMALAKELKIAFPDKKVKKNRRK